MKRVYLLLAGFGFSVAAHAQLKDTIFIVPGVTGHELTSSSLLMPKATLLAENNLGKVYSLPIDNMHFLVPNTKNIIPIPTKKLFLQKGSMPNSFYKILI